MARACWKQCAEWVIALLHKYQSDPFFRSEVNIIALQGCFALIIVGLVGISFAIIDRQIVEAIAASSYANVTTPATLAPEIIARMEAIRSHNLAGIISVVLLATVVLGYIVARVALAPTRDTLAAQKRFIGNVAHELRTPLSILKTNTEIALLEENVPSDMRHMLASNIEELDRISEIINNLLSLSTMTRPDRLEFSEINLAKVVNETVAALAPLAKLREHDVTIRKSPDVVIWGNATALQQIVGNLLKNALNHTPQNGTIAVTVARAPDNMVELLIQDSGIGIERRDLFRIFEPFYRADPSRSRVHGGTGLGLAIVSELVKLHQGKITVRSAVGRGTSVSVLFPAARPRAVTEGERGNVGGMNEIVVDFSA